MNIFRYCSESHAFILIDGRNISTERFRKSSTARMLCAVNDAEAIVILENDPGSDFRMSVIPGGDTGSADAGSRARACAVAFADLLGLKPRGGSFTYGTAAPSKTFTFNDVIAEAGTVTRLFSAEVMTHFGESKMICLDGQSGIETICEGEL